MEQASRFTNLIVTYNSANEISDLLSDLRNLALYAASRVIVVDNASRDQTVALVATRFPEVCVAQNARNVGYARAVNHGFGLSSTEYVFLLNPDIRILDPTFFSTMLECMERNPNIAAAGPLQFQQAGDRRWLNFTWSYWSQRGLAVFLSHMPRLRSGSRFDAPISTRFLNAGCLLIRRSAFVGVGKLSERYFLYGEEPDLFLKFWRHGYECKLHPGIEVIHFREQSLRTLPSVRRCLVKFWSVFNIGDAILRGCANMMLDRLQEGERARVAV